VAGPLPLGGLSTVIHETDTDDVHEQPDPVCSVKLPLPPESEKLRLPGEIEYEQGATAAACLIWIDASLTTTVAVRTLGCELAPTFRVSVPSPWPVAGAACVQDASLRLVHAHSRSAVTATVTCVAAAGTSCVAGESVS